MNPGELRQRLVFLQPASGTDGEGFRIKESSPTVYTKARAKLKTLKGNTFYNAAQHGNEHNRQFVIRYQKILMDDVRPKGLLLVWREVEHEIVSIENDDGLNKTMTVVVKAVS
ncbi:phage head closure protein [Sutcliffiella horikoshii]|uniref:phage head closure protein n=1 Tax=Sutcliffiella horikoshii TaxID=79883 RepID=UPI00203BC72A|nr:phage head closure protein [Sutcliffiella horikoshii]MCM3619164.1 phage head closure protein [Sutcliffiella horikoshii]